jgi:hypothetical protein
MIPARWEIVVRPMCATSSTSAQPRGLGYIAEPFRLGCIALSDRRKKVCHLSPEEGERQVAHRREEGGLEGTIQ